MAATGHFCTSHGVEGGPTRCAGVGAHEDLAAPAGAAEFAAAGRDRGGGGQTAFLCEHGNFLFNCFKHVGQLCHVSPRPRLICVASGCICLPAPLVSRCEEGGPLRVAQVEARCIFWEVAGDPLLGDGNAVHLFCGAYHGWGQALDVLAELTEIQFGLQLHLDWDLTAVSLAAQAHEGFIWTRPSTQFRRSRLCL